MQSFHGGKRTFSTQAIFAEAPTNTLIAIQIHAVPSRVTCWPRYCYITIIVLCGEKCLHFLKRRAYRCVQADTRTHVGLYTHVGTCTHACTHTYTSADPIFFLCIYLFIYLKSPLKKRKTISVTRIKDGRNLTWFK